MTIEILFTGNKSSASPELERDIFVGGILLNFDTEQNHISIKGQLNCKPNKIRQHIKYILISNVNVFFRYNILYASCNSDFLS